MVNLNLIKKYPDLLDIIHLNEYQRKKSLKEIYERDIVNHPNLCFRGKTIRPIKDKDGQPATDTLFHHLTTEKDESKEGKKNKRRNFEIDRSMRLHWILPHLEEQIEGDIEVFSCEERVDGKDVINTYIYNKEQKYVIVLRPQRSEQDYYLLSAYYLNKSYGVKVMKKKMKKKLDKVY